MSKKLLVLVDEIYEDLELWYPKIRLEEAGFQAVTSGPVKDQVYKGKHGYPCRADLSHQDVKVQEFAGIIVPGGYAPDKLRRSQEVLHMVKAMHEAKKLVAFICHGGWVPISAKVLKGKKATGAVAIRDDLENAGAMWVDEAVVVDHHVISSRSPADLPDFMKAILHFLK